MARSPPPPPPLALSPMTPPWAHKSDVCVYCDVKLLYLFCFELQLRMYILEIAYVCTFMVKLFCQYRQHACYMLCNSKVRGSLRRVGFSFTANTLICQIEIRFTSQRNELNQLGLNDSMFKPCYWYCAKKKQYTVVYIFAYIL